MASELKPCQIADALETCDWAGASIGNKLIVLSAIEALRNIPVATPADATDVMVDAALAVDWENEDERATVHNVWHAMTAHLPTPVAPVSPDATGKCGELVTVAGEYLDGHTWKPIPSDITDFALRGVKTRALCDRSQAVELLAAKDKIIDRHREAQVILGKQLNEVIADNAAKVEQERLRFEGDLDKWMKIIGAGITGYQPEAYALMDLACEELVTLRADNAALTARVKELEHALTEKRRDRIGDSEKGGAYLCRAKNAEAKAEALETKLAAARRVLERADEALQLGATEPGHTYVKIALGEVQS